MKRAIKYLRFSDDKQSQHSFERQDMIITAWQKALNVDVIDSFQDEGYTARTFDRPDVKSLFAFIRKNYRSIDYLVVSELTRFSRKAGEAITMVEQIQKEYGIKIVSASRSQIYDVFDPNSFMMMALEFILGNSENIKRTNDINGGIYAAKAIKGKFIGPRAPYGYVKSGSGKDVHLILDDHKAAIVQFLFSSFLEGVPLYILKENAIKKGFSKKGNDAIVEILRNPVYMGFQHVNAWKDQPGGLFPLTHHINIVEPSEWYRVQEKFKVPSQRKIIDDDVPLRGMLRCYCQNKVTGAPSRGKTGKYWLYYKCNQKSHTNNLSANEAHRKIREVLELMSLPDYLVEAIREESETMLDQKMKENTNHLAAAKRKLQRLEDQLHSVENKFISEQIAVDVYQKWRQDLSAQRIDVRADIERFQRNENEAWYMLSGELEKLTDMKFLYDEMDTLGKQNLLGTVFDNSLYYQEKVYRTPFVMEPFTHNALIMKERNLLIIDKWDYQNHDNPVRWS